MSGRSELPLGVVSRHCRSVARGGREDHALSVGRLMPFPPPAWSGGIKSDLIANDLTHEQSEAFVTVETYVPVAFDVQHEVTGVRPPVSKYGVIAIVCADGLQNISLFLGS